MFLFPFVRLWNTLFSFLFDPVLVSWPLALFGSTKFLIRMASSSKSCTGGWWPNLLRGVLPCELWFPLVPVTGLLTGSSRRVLLGDVPLLFSCTCTSLRCAVGGPCCKRADLLGGVPLLLPSSPSGFLSFSPLVDTFLCFSPLFSTGLRRGLRLGIRILPFLARPRLPVVLCRHLSPLLSNAFAGASVLQLPVSCPSLLLSLVSALALVLSLLASFPVDPLSTLLFPTPWLFALPLPLESAGPLGAPLPGAPLPGAPLSTSAKFLPLSAPFSVPFPSVDILDMNQRLIPKGWLTADPIRFRRQCTTKRGARCFLYLLAVVFLPG